MQRQECTLDQDLEAARGGDPHAFARLIAPHRARLRSVALRILGHPEDAEDALQDALLRASQHIHEFRGESSVSTWLHAIVARTCLNQLRSRKRWPAAVQTDLRAAYSQELSQSPDSPLRDADFCYDASEHIAFCLTCVSRSLDPEEQVALLLRDVFELSNDEAARAMELSLGTFRHRLAAARQNMASRYEGLCRLVSKEGVCYQCAELREAMPPPLRGPEVPELRLRSSAATVGSRLRELERRAQVSREADLESGPSARLHAEMFRKIRSLLGHV